jgi:type I restriction enzyme S subunit
MTDWPTKTFGELFDSKPKNSGPLKQKDYLPSGKFPVVDQGQELIGGFTNDQHLVRDFETPVIVFGDHTRCVKYIDFPFASGADGTKILVPRKGVDPKYAYFQLLSIELPTKGYARHFAELSKHSFVLPPLAEQKRIVELLDAATERVTELTACYEQARTHANNLFTSALREALDSNPGWPIKTLGEVCQIEMGRTPSRGESTGWDKELKTSNHWASIADLTACRGRVLSSTKERISDFAARTTKVVPAGTLMMSFKLSIGKLAFAGCDLYTNEAIAAFHLPEQSDVDSEFLYWALKVVDWASLTKGSEKVKGATMNKAKLNLLQIPVPPLEEQKRIVATLGAIEAKTSEMVAAYDAKLTATKSLRQSILEAAFAGGL